MVLIFFGLTPGKSKLFLNEPPHPNCSLPYFATNRLLNSKKIGVLTVSIEKRVL